MNVVKYNKAKLYRKSTLNGTDCNTCDEVFLDKRIHKDDRSCGNHSRSHLERFLREVCESNVRGGDRVLKIRNLVDNLVQHELKRLVCNALAQEQ